MKFLLDGVGREYDEEMPRFYWPDTREEIEGAPDGADCFVVFPGEEKWRYVHCRVRHGGEIWVELETICPKCSTPIGRFLREGT